MKKQILVGVMLLSGAAIQSVYRPTPRNDKATTSDRKTTDYHYSTGTTQGNLAQPSKPYNDGKTYTLVTNKPLPRVGKPITVELRGKNEQIKGYLTQNLPTPNQIKTGNYIRQYYIVVDGKKVFIEQLPNDKWGLSGIYYKKDNNLNYSEIMTLPASVRKLLLPSITVTDEHGKTTVVNLKE